MLLITGGSGKLGRELRKLFPDALAPSSSELDLTSKGETSRYIKSVNPQAIIHLAALTDLKKCEENKELAYRINVSATENLVESVLTYAPLCYFVYMSSAGVFYGDRGDYTEEDIPNPKNYYSLTKLLSEFVSKRIPSHLIVRSNFMVREKWPYEKAFVDRWGTYLFAEELASALGDLFTIKMTGLVHVAGDKKLSMFELAKTTTPDVKPITLSEAGIPWLARDVSLISVRIKPYEFR